MGDGWTEVNTSWKGDMTFISENERGSTVQMSGQKDQPGIGPMQLLLAATAGCTGIDIVSILQKKRLKLTDMQIKVRGKRASDYPMIWTDIHIIYNLWGEDIPAKDVEQAIQLSEEKYCSVSQNLRKSTNITSEYHILKPGQTAG